MRGPRGRIRPVHMAFRQRHPEKNSERGATAPGVLFAGLDQSP